MLRGSRSIFASLFHDDVTDVLVPAPERKGRSEALINKRNELLVCRYYFLVKIADYKYPKALAKLEEEIFLTQRTIIDTIQRNHALLKELHHTRPDVKYFKNKFPFFVW